MANYRTGIDLKNCPYDCEFLCHIDFGQSSSMACLVQSDQICPRDEAEKCGTESTALGGTRSGVCPDQQGAHQWLSARRD